MQADPYRLINVASGKALSIADQSGANGALVNQWDWVNVQSQQWSINPIGNGYSTIQNVNSAKVITSAAPSPNSDTTQWDWNGWAVQQWRIDPIPNTSFFKIVSYYDNSIVLDMRNADLENNVMATVSTWDESTSQQWQLEAINPHQVTQSINVMSSGNGASGVVSMDNDYESSYHYVNLVSASMLINGIEVSRTCQGCPKINPANPHGPLEGAPFVGYGETAVYNTSPVPPGSYIEVEGTAVSYAAYQVYQTVPNCGNFCNDWADPFSYGTYGILQQDPGAPELSDVVFRTTVYYAPEIIASTVVLQNTVLRQTSRSSTTSPGLRDAFLINYRTFIPSPYVDGPDTCSTGPIVRQLIYKGDNRHFSPFSGTDRASSRFSVSSYTGQVVLGPLNIAGISERYAEDALQPDGTLLSDSVLHDCHLLDNTGFGGITASATASGGGGAVNIQMSGAATDLITLAGAMAPAIDWNFDVHIIANVAPQKSSATVHYHHDCFPAHELYSGSDWIYKWEPKYRNIFYVSACLGGLRPIDGDQSEPIR